MCTFPRILTVGRRKPSGPTLSCYLTTVYLNCIGDDQPEYVSAVFICQQGGGGQAGVITFMSSIQGNLETGRVEGGGKCSLTMITYSSPYVCF